MCRIGKKRLCFKRNRCAGFALATDARLDFGVERDAVGDAVFRDTPVRRDRLACIVFGVPRACIEQRELMPGFCGDSTASVRAAVGGVVVHQQQRAVAREFDVDFGGTIAMRNA